MVLLVFHMHQPFNRRRRSLPNHFFRNLILDTSGPRIPRGQPFTYDLTQSVVGAFRISGCLQPRAVAELLSHEVGIDVDTLQRITEHLPWGFQPVTPTVIADQQKIADTFFSLNLVPKRLDVRAATLPVK